VTPQLAFKIAWGINLHFGSLSYSVLKYGTNTKAATAKYEKLSRSQLYKYEWFADKFPTHQEIMYCTIGCQFDGVSTQFGGKQEILDSFYKMKARREALSFTLKSNHSKNDLLGNLSTEKLVIGYIGGEFSPEYVILKDHDKDELIKLYENSKFSWAHSAILKLLKYKDFIPVSKYLPLVQHNEEYA
jgi:hypothetical protein